VDDDFFRPRTLVRPCWALCRCGPIHDSPSLSTCVRRSASNSPVTVTVLADPPAAGRRRPAGRLLLPMGPSTPLRLVHNLAVILLLVPLVFAPVASAGTNSSLVHLGLAISYAAAVSLVSLALFVHGSLSC
jgi:hypothetical protein